MYIRGVGIPSGFYDFYHSVSIGFLTFLQFKLFRDHKIVCNNGNQKRRRRRCKLANSSCPFVMVADLVQGGGNVGLVHLSTLAERSHS